VNMADRITGRGLSMKSKHPAHVVDDNASLSREEKKAIINIVDTIRVA
jgi:hypothetical protein